MESERIHRRLVAIFAADVADYSRLMSADETGTLKALTAHRAVMDRLIEEHDGRIANTAGDSVLAEFPSVVDAVQCAVEVQKAFADTNGGRNLERRLEFRIGVHVGDVMTKGGDLFGDGVNIAARLQALAEPGGLCVSGGAYDLARKMLTLPFVDHGLQALKNIPEPVQVFAFAPAGPSVAAASSDFERGPLALPGKPSIAVLAFTNLSGDPEQDYFAEGIADEILTALSRFRELFVIARTSSFTYKGKAVDAKQIGRELGVRYLLEGSVRKAGPRLRIMGQLVDAASGTHVWADRFEGGLDDVFDLQDRVTAAVVGAVAPTIERAEIERAKRKPTESLDAYDCFMRAAACAYRWTRPATEEAERLLRRSMELDPEFATAHGAACWCIAWRLLNEWSDDAGKDVAACGRLARQAVELAKDDATVLAWAGYSLAMVLGELDDGITLLDRALTLNPNLARAWTMSAVVNVLLGNPEVAIEHNERAIRLSPRDNVFHLMLHTSARACFYAGRYDEAIAWSTKAMQASPHGHDQSLIHLIASYALTQRQAEAEKALARLHELNPQSRLSTLWPFSRLRRADDVARLKEGLRLAGMPE